MAWNLPKRENTKPAHCQPTLHCRLEATEGGPACDLAQLVAAGGARLRLQDAQRLGLALQVGQAVWGVAGGDHYFIEHARAAVRGAAELADLLGKIPIHLPAPASAPSASPSPLHPAIERMTTAPEGVELLCGGWHGAAG